MTILTKSRVRSDVIVEQLSSRYNFEAGAIKNDTLAEINAAGQLANADPLQDMLGYPLDKDSDGVYGLVLDSEEATCDAILIGHKEGRSQFFDPKDATAALAAAATGSTEWLILDNFTGVVLREGWAPSNDVAGNPLDQSALNTAVIALGAKIADEPATSETQTT